MARSVITNDFGMRVVMREASLMALQQSSPKSGIGLNNLDRAQKFSLSRNGCKNGGRSISPAAPVLSL